MEIKRIKKHNFSIPNPSSPRKIERSNLFSSSSFPISEDFVITELDKAMVYNNILKEDETGIIGYDEDFIYCFNDNLHNIISKMLRLELYEPKHKNPINEEEILEILPKDSFRRLLVNKEYATVIDIKWPKYRTIVSENGEATISTYPVKRKVPFVFLNNKEVVEIDLLPLIRCHSNCLDSKELMKRLKKRYREEWEKNFGNWDEKFGNKKITYVS